MTTDVSAAAWLDQLHGEPPTPFGQSLAEGQVASDHEDRASARAEAEKRAAADERRETWAISERMMGNPSAQVTRCQLDLASAQDVVTDLEAQLAKAVDSRDRCRSNLAFFAERAMLAFDSADRAVVAPAAGFPLAEQSARAAFQDGARVRSQVLEQARSQQAARRTGVPRDVPGSFHSTGNPLCRCDLCRSS